MRVTGRRPHERRVLRDAQVDVGRGRLLLRRQARRASARATAPSPPCRSGAPEPQRRAVRRARPVDEPLRGRPAGPCTRPATSGGAAAMNASIGAAPRRAACRPPRAAPRRGAASPRPRAAVLHGPEHPARRPTRARPGPRTRRPPRASASTTRTDSARGQLRTHGDRLDPREGARRRARISPVAGDDDRPLPRGGLQRPHQLGAVARGRSRSRRHLVRPRPAGRWPASRAPAAAGERRRGRSGRPSGGGGRGRAPPRGAARRRAGCGRARGALGPGASRSRGVHRGVDDAAHRVEVAHLGREDRARRRAATRRRPSAISARTSAARQPGDGLDEVGVHRREAGAADARGPCTRRPPAGGPAESPGGLVKTLPKVRTPWGWVARRWARNSASRAAIASRVAGAQARSRPPPPPRRGRPTSAGSRAPGRRARRGGARRARRSRPSGAPCASSPAWAPAFIATAPPTVPGMLAPHSRPSRPCAAARCTARGREAPPPHQRSVAAHRDRRQAADQPQHQAAEALVGDQQVGAAADDRHRRAGLARPGERPHHVAERRRPAEPVGGAARRGSW